MVRCGLPRAARILVFLRILFIIFLLSLHRRPVRSSAWARSVLTGCACTPLVLKLIPRNKRYHPILAVFFSLPISEIVICFGGRGC
jgi:hypothetical protein